MKLFLQKKVRASLQQNSASTTTKALVVKGCDQEKKKYQNFEKLCNYFKKKGIIKAECYKLHNQNKKDS